MRTIILSIGAAITIVGLGLITGNIIGSTAVGAGLCVMGIVILDLLEQVADKEA